MVREMIGTLRKGLAEFWKELGRIRYDAEVRMGWKRREVDIPESWLKADMTPLEALFDIPLVDVEESKPELAEEPTFKFYEEPKEPSILKPSTKIKLKQVFVFFLFLFSIFGAYGVIRADTLILEWPFLVFHLLTAGAYLDYLRRHRTRRTKKWYLLQDIEKD